MLVAFLDFCWSIHLIQSKGKKFRIIAGPHHQILCFRNHEESESAKENKYHATSDVCSILKDLYHSMTDKQVVGNGGFILFIAARGSWRWGMVILMMILPTYLKEKGFESSADLTGTLPVRTQYLFFMVPKCSCAFSVFIGLRNSFGKAIFHDGSLVS